MMKDMFVDEFAGFPGFADLLLLHGFFDPGLALRPHPTDRGKQFTIGFYWGCGLQNRWSHKNQSEKNSVGTNPQWIGTVSARFCTCRPLRQVRPVGFLTISTGRRSCPIWYRLFHREGPFFYKCSTTNLFFDLGEGFSGVTAEMKIQELLVLG